MKPNLIEELSPLEYELFALYEVCIMGKTKIEINCGTCKKDISLTLNGFPARCWCPECKTALIIDEVKENTTDGYQSGYIVYAFSKYLFKVVNMTFDEIFEKYKAGEIRFDGPLRGLQFITET